MKTKSPFENSKCVNTFKAWVAPAVTIMSSLEGRGGEGRGGEGRGGEGRGGEGRGGEGRGGEGRGGEERGGEGRGGEGRGGKGKEGRNGMEGECIGISIAISNVQLRNKKYRYSDVKYST